MGTFALIASQHTTFPDPGLVVTKKTPNPFIFIANFIVHETIQLGCFIFYLGLPKSFFHIFIFFERCYKIGSLPKFSLHSIK